MVIAYSSTSPQSSGSGQGPAILRLARVDTNPDYRKPYFSCPGCAKRSGKLVLAQQEWASRKCLGLDYRSQHLGPDYRKQQRREELFQLLRPDGGEPTRPRYIRAERFADLVAEYEALRGDLRDKPRLVPERSLRLTLRPSWERSSEPWPL